MQVDALMRLAQKKCVMFPTLEPEDDQKKLEKLAKEQKLDEESIDEVEMDDTGKTFPCSRKPQSTLRRDKGVYC